MGGGTSHLAPVLEPAGPDARGGGLRPCIIIAFLYQHRGAVTVGRLPTELHEEILLIPGDAGPPKFSLRVGLSTRVADVMDLLATVQAHVHWDFLVDHAVLKVPEPVSPLSSFLKRRSTSSERLVASAFMNYT